MAALVTDQEFDGAASLPPRSEAISASTRVFDALWRWGGVARRRQGYGGLAHSPADAKRRRVGGGGYSVRFMRPPPRPPLAALARPTLPTARKSSRGEGDRRRLAHFPDRLVEHKAIDIHGRSFARKRERSIRYERRAR
jgi:hypothetical protein